MTLKDIEIALKDPELLGGLHEVKLTVTLRGRAYQVMLQDSGWKAESATGSNLEEVVKIVFKSHGVSV
jgi:hypothetical protein